MNDKRSSQRIDAGHLLSIEIFNEENEVVFAGMALSKDLSRTGVQIENRMAFPNNTKVKIQLAIDEDVVHITGFVIHSEKIDENLYCLGVKFSEIPENELLIIQKKYPQI